MSGQLLPLIVAGALFLAVMALGLLAMLAMRARAERQLRGRLTRDAPASGQDRAAASGWLEDLEAGGRAVERLVDTDNETPRLLVQAGWRSTAQRSYFYIAQLLLPFLAACLAVFVWLLSGETATSLELIIYLLIGVFAGLLAPRFLLRRKAESRQRRIAGEVPLFIHLLVLLFEAGLSTRQALASLVREGGGTLPELNRELAVVIRQLEAGADSSEVLRNLEEALEVSELGNVLGVLRQVDRYGGEVRGPLLEALEVLEQRRSMTMREKVNNISGRMTVVMVLFFFPALLVFVAGPAFVSILKALGNVAG